MYTGSTKLCRDLHLGVVGIFFAEMLRLRAAERWLSISVRVPDLKGFYRPIVRGSGRPGHGIGRFDFGPQLSREFGRRHRNRINKLRIPIAMQFIARLVREAIDSDFHIVSAMIMVVRRMERLMHVTHQMQQKFQGKEPLLRIGRRRREFGLALLNLVDRACLGRPV